MTLLDLAKNPWTIAAAVILFLIVISTLSRISTGVRRPVARETIQQSKVLLNAANRWALMAKQDQNPVMALMHICYAKAYVESLRQILKDEQIQQAHQTDMVEMSQRMDQIEQDTIRKLNELAPSLMPEGEFAVRAGWV